MSRASIQALMRPFFFAALKLQRMRPGLLGVNKGRRVVTCYTAMVIMTSACLK